RLARLRRGGAYTFGGGVHRDAVLGDFQDAADAPDRVLEREARYDGGLVLSAILEILGSMIEEVIEGNRDRVVLDAGQKSALNFLKQSFRHGEHVRDARSRCLTGVGDNP